MKRPAWWKPRTQRSRIEWFTLLALRWGLAYTLLRLGAYLAAGGHLG